ncbi:hypothetical protein GCM10011583_54880 [Streptomyces camponoticapitis]|uniref:Uncharacterized protein n=1 Tax=Streptomyces camponoticapitis TaxID=1616125 RepID=A0ABQ2EQ52_9ACTN|nr:hypothetical protein GCM10011583_54880 [Streptomyces camponoticapitis]
MDNPVQRGHRPVPRAHRHGIRPRGPQPQRCSSDLPAYKRARSRMVSDRGGGYDLIADPRTTNRAHLEGGALLSRVGAGEGQPFITVITLRHC